MEVGVGEEEESYLQGGVGGGGREAGKGGGSGRGRGAVEEGEVVELVGGRDGVGEREERGEDAGDEVEEREGEEESKGDKEWRSSVHLILTSPSDLRVLPGERRVKVSHLIRFGD